MVVSAYNRSAPAFTKTYSSMLSVCRQPTVDLTLSLVTMFLKSFKQLHNFTEVSAALQAVVVPLYSLGHNSSCNWCSKK